MLGVTIATYANSLANAFHYDDVFTILRNPGVQMVERLPEHFWSGTMGNQHEMPSYRPLVMVTYGLNYWWGGTSPEGYHVVNLALHLMTSVLVVLLYWQLSGQAAASAFAGFVFALHPIQTEAVNYITARSSLLYTAAGMASIYGFVRYRSTGRIGALACSALTYSAALFAKEAAVVVVPLLIGYDVIVRREAWSDLSRWGRPHVPFIVLTLAYVALRGLIIGDALAHTYPGYHAGVFTAGVTFAAIVTKTLAGQLAPVRLSFSHHFEPLRELTPSAVGAILGFAVLIGTGVLARRRYPLLAYAAIWFPVALLPLAALPLVTPIALYQENRGYLSAVATSFVIGAVLAWCWEPGHTHRGRNLLFRSAVCLLFVAMVVAVVVRNSVWRDDVSLWLDALRKAPDNQVAYVNLGAAYAARGDFPAVADVYRQALERFPGNAILHNNLGAIYRQLGDLDRAADEFRAAIRANRRFAMGFFHLGQTLQEAGEWAEAASAFRRFLELAPGQSGATPSIEEARRRLADVERGEPSVN